MPKRKNEVFPESFFFWFFSFFQKRKESSVRRGIGVGIVAPEHVLPQLGAHGLHLVLGQLGPLGVEEGAAVLVLGNPSA